MIVIPRKVHVLFIILTIIFSYPVLAEEKIAPEERLRIAIGVNREIIIQDLQKIISLPPGVEREARGLIFAHSFSTPAFSAEALMNDGLINLFSQAIREGDPMVISATLIAFENMGPKAHSILPLLLRLRDRKFEFKNDYKLTFGFRARVCSLIGRIDVEEYRKCLGTLDVTR